MTVADLLHMLQQQDPRAIVVAADPEYRGLLSNFLVSEVRPVHMQAAEDLVLPLLRIAEDGPLTGLLLGRLP